MGSRATTPKVWGYRPGGSHLGSFLTRQLSPVTTGWAMGPSGSVFWTSPTCTAHGKTRKWASGRQKLTHYEWWLHMHISYWCWYFYIWTLENSKIPNCDFYTPICYVVLLTELSNSPLTPTTFSGYNKPESLFGNGIDLAKGNRTLGDWCNLYIV